MKFSTRIPIFSSTQIPPKNLLEISGLFSFSESLKNDVSLGVLWWFQRILEEKNRPDIGESYVAMNL